MPMHHRYAATCLLAALLLLPLGCYKDEPAEASTEHTGQTPDNLASNGTATQSGPTAEERAARKAEREARREQRLAELTPEQREIREANRAERQARQQANRDDANDGESQAERETGRAERRQQNVQERLQNKAWWNKRNSKQLAGLELSEQQQSDMDQRLQSLLDTRDQLGAELEPLWQSNRDALASGDVGLIASNLERIEQLESQWQVARRTAVIDILESLDNAQLAALAQADSDIATLNWLDISLEKGVDRPRGNRRQQNNNREQQRDN